MSTTTPASTTSAEPSPRGYKLLLIRARELTVQGGARALERAELLCAVFDDADFRAECGGTDDVLAGVLDDYCEDLCLSFLQLRGLLGYFGADGECWKTGKLRTGYERMLHERPRGPAAARPASKRRTATVAELDKLQARCKRAEQKSQRADELACEVGNLDDQLTAAHERIAQLEAENHELRMQLLTLSQQPIAA